MPDVGDRVEVLSKGGTRLGEVVRVSGTLVSVAWDTGGQTTVIPAPGVMSVVGGRRRPVKKAAPKKAATKKAAPKKAAPKKAAPKKAAPKKSPAKKGAGKKAAASKKKGKKRR